MSDQVAAEAWHQALAAARLQSAKTWKLRATTSLTGLWRDQGKRNEAHDLLAPVYGWFTEGFDTLDLKQAQGVARRAARLTTNFEPPTPCRIGSDLRQ